MDARTHVPAPLNEPVYSYAPGSPERARVESELARQLAQGPLDIPAVIGGARHLRTNSTFQVVEPHRHAHVLGNAMSAGRVEAELAIDAALAAAPAWRDLDFDSRAAIFLKAAELLAGPWRERLNVATMLGQSKTVFQAEIDSACELIDFLRFNVHFARQILEVQPVSSPGVWNRADHRPLEGFVYAVTPFNFTAIAGNLPTAPAMMGNTVVWKPAPTGQYAAHFVMALLEEAGLPPGVINMLPGDGLAVSDVVLDSPELAGIHFTGSTAVFQSFWQRVGTNIPRYRSYPRIVGETGGKDFLVAHPSADPEVVTAAMIRGAFEYQGQKCSAASRAYVARSVWDQMSEALVAGVEGLTMGPVDNFANFMGAVIDSRSHAKLVAALGRARDDSTVTVLAGGQADDTEGYFVRPTVLVGTDPGREFFTDEYFGPILSIYVYDDGDFENTLGLVDATSPYGLTGAILSQDRSAIAEATHRLRFSAGNFYINDKPTGAVVGQQPFGGSRSSGTNDKAGAAANLMRWVSSRSIKETFDPPRTVSYPHMG